MALASTTVWEVQTGGSDTNNGGAFDSGQTAGMFTDGAATSANTSAPVFSSASYNFVAGDVGAWVYISSGTNWTAGWYKISSVASNKATLNATIGQAVIKTTYVLSTVVGCATVASPTTATWSIDYSQQTTARFTYTDLASAGAGLTVSSAAFPFAKQHVGNSIVITGGTNFTTGRYVIASVAAGVATVVGAANITTGAGASGTGGMGGACASPGKVAGVMVVGNRVFIKSGTYSITSASTNIAGGCIITNLNGVYWNGYGSIRSDLGTRPILQASGISTATLINHSTGYGEFINLTFDGNNLTSIQGFNGSNGGNGGWAYLCIAKNCTNSGFSCQRDLLIKCVATGCTTAGAAMATASAFMCEAYSNTVTGFSNSGQGQGVINCLSYNNSGATTDGFSAANDSITINCVAYNNGRDGFKTGRLNVNCIAEKNGAFGFNHQASVNNTAFNCATFNNTSGGLSGTGSVVSVAPIALSASPFVAAASNNFTLNNTAGAGASCRAVGMPGTFINASSTVGYADMGAAQHADPTGASGGFFIQ